MKCGKRRRKKAQKLCDSIRHNRQMLGCGGLSRPADLTPSVINRLVSRWRPQTSFPPRSGPTCHSGSFVGIFLTSGAPLAFRQK